MKTFKKLCWAIVDPDTGKAVAANMCGYSQFKFVAMTKNIKLWVRASAAQKKLEEHRRYVSRTRERGGYREDYIMPYDPERLFVCRVVVTLEIYSKENSK